MAEQTTQEVMKDQPAQVSELGVGGESPAAQQAKISDPSGGTTVDTEARTAINSIIDALEAFGLTSKT